MNKQQIIGTMVQGAFFSVNKKLAKYLGSNDAALILSHLIYLQEQFFQGAEFYQQQERIMEECNVSISALRIAMALLKKKGLLSVVKKGVPAKNFYLISLTSIAEILSTPDPSLQSDKFPTTGTTDSIPPVGRIRRTSTTDSTPQRVYKKKANNTIVNKKLNNSNIKDILLRDKLLYKGTKIPSAYEDPEDYYLHLYTQHYGQGAI
jgi:hypothetical protein